MVGRGESLGGTKQMTKALSEHEIYRFGFSEAGDDRIEAFEAARLCKLSEPDATVIVYARDTNEGYEIYLDTELKTRLKQL